MPAPQPPPETSSTGDAGVYQPQPSSGKGFEPINVSAAEEQQALNPSADTPAEIRAINPPAARPESFEDRGHRAGGGDEFTLTAAEESPAVPVASAQGSSPAPIKTFQGETLSSGSIPPDTMGAVGPNHVVSVSNNQMNIRTRTGVLLTRLTLNAFWAGVTLEGGITTPSTFDPKIFYDRFNDRWFFFTSANSVSPASSVLFATTQTGDPTGTWNRYVFDTDAAATAASGRWADYPTVGHNSQWIVANYNVFNYSGTATTGYYGPYIYVIPKSVAYANTASITSSLFQTSASTCVAPFESQLGCGFTMAPTVNEDNTTTVNYLVEDWDSVFGQLRVSKITGPANAPVLTVGTQFPQSTENWRFNAARIGTTGGYLPQRHPLNYAADITARIMANDSRINNAVLRNGSLWTSHHVMVGAAPTPPGTAYGTANPDIKTAAQWWQIDPSIEAQPDAVTGLGTAPTQRGRIFDPTADNCNSGNSASVSTARAGCTQQGQFFAFVAIAVNQNNDAFIGFSQFSPLTFPSAAYAMRRASDPANTMRDVVVYRSGAANYNLGAGTAGTSARQNRWGDYSSAEVDPVNDTDFWTVQEYADTRTNFGLGAIAGPWATWWARVSPTSTQPTTTGNLIISEFRPRGPGGINDEFIELYNPSATTPFRVQSADNSEGWALATNNGTTTTPLTVIPQGVVVPPRGHYLIANSAVQTSLGAETVYYSLRSHPGSESRTATADTGYSPLCATTNCGVTTDTIADNTGIAIFRSSTPAAFIAANQADAAGFAGVANTLFREGAGIPAITAGTVTGQITFVRNQTSGTHQDTNANENDFQILNTNAPTESLGVAALLGAPGPENVDAPRLNNNVFVDRLDKSVGLSSAPNRVRDLTPVTNGGLGTLSMRRNVYNNTGQTVTRVRFRIRQTSTFPAPAGTADLRALSSGNISVSVNDMGLCGGAPPCNVSVLGTIIEEPPTQPNGGGWNTTLSFPLPAPLAPGDNVNVQFVFGVVSGGTFSIVINTEALP
ncbi:MAG TPA: lamin tail domain-containing protein [Pyrinomonadaceae bacterium]